MRAFFPMAGGAMAAAASPTAFFSVASAKPVHSTPYVIAGTPAACTYCTALIPWLRMVLMRPIFPAKLLILLTCTWVDLLLLLV